MTDCDYSDYQRWKGWSAESFGYFDRALDVYLRKEFERSGFGAIAGLHVLEIGFGNGAFGAWARDKGAVYTGTELIPELLATARASGFSVHSALEPIHSVVAPNSIDVAVAFDVLEHVDGDGLRPLMHSIHGCLREGGMLIARVPSGDSPFSRAIQYGDLTHRTTLGSSAVAQLARETGFEVNQIREPAFPLCGHGVRAYLRRLAVTAVRRLTYRFIRDALMGGGRLVLTPNMLLVLRKPGE